jgi:hypothetical protein
MISKISLSAAVLAAAVVFAARPSVATPAASFSALKGTAASQPSIVDQAHFFHRTCRRGANGWHKHVRTVGRIQCTNQKCDKNGKCFWY